MPETEHVEMVIEVPSEWNKIALFLDACELTNSEAIWVAMKLIDTTLSASPLPARDVIRAGLVRHLRG